MNLFFTNLRDGIKVYKQEVDHPTHIFHYRQWSYLDIHQPFKMYMGKSILTVVRQTLDRQTLNTTNSRQTNGGHNKH